MKMKGRIRITGHEDGSRQFTYELPCKVADVEKQFNLHVAAPAMLEALESLAEYLECNYDHNELAMAKVDVALKAIAEAKGENQLKCDKEDCPHPITHIDGIGFIYCSHHGKMRKLSYKCRKLTSKELTTLKSGKDLAAY